MPSAESTWQVRIGESFSGSNNNTSLSCHVSINPEMVVVLSSYDPGVTIFHLTTHNSQHIPFSLSLSIYFSLSLSSFTSRFSHFFFFYSICPNSSSFNAFLSHLLSALNPCSYTFKQPNFLPILD
ncbi:hypothetical protein FRX31_005708 [Thalictrum thalictroides]|uniref:Uncharacterized protein n=1 Tax=Thalictrum thalictroides TaxID=46969 RepID=A0A7J6X6L2_THATH|nr:hypothetical protein FRX31_005708 [Thalictrum thalictroides]